MADLETAGMGRVEHSDAMIDGGVGNKFRYKALPSDSYSFAIYTIFVRIDRWHCRDDKLVVLILGLVTAMLLLLANFCLQFGFLIYTIMYVVQPTQKHLDVIHTRFFLKYRGRWDMTTAMLAMDAHDHIAKEMCEVPVTDPRFQYIILFLWTVMMLKEFWQCCEHFNDLRALPKCVERGRMVHRQPTGEGAYSRVIVAATWPVRLSVMLGVVLPKFIICLFLWHYGVQWLVSTSGFMDLILNSLALAFIVEFDELLFAALVPSVVQAKVGATEMRLSVSRDSKLTKYWNTSLGTLALLVYATGVVMVYNTYMLPDVLHEHALIDHAAIQPNALVKLLDHNEPCRYMVKNWWEPYDEQGRAHRWWKKELEDLKRGGADVDILEDGAARDGLVKQASTKARRAVKRGR